MNETISIVEMVEEHGPILLKTAKLITVLRQCTLFATTPQAAGITLQKVGAISPRFATELSSMANDGLDVFGEATKYFLNIQLAARSMLSTTERLQQSFGKPEERVTHDRLLKTLDRQIGSCTEGSAELKGQLSAWRKHMKDFEIAIQRTQAGYQKEAVAAALKIGKLSLSLEQEKKQLERARNVEVEAKKTYEDAKTNKQSLIQDIVFPENFETPEVAYQIFKYSWNWFWSRDASQDARSAQDERERRKRATEAFEGDIADAEVGLAFQNAKSFDLEKCKKGVEHTLRALATLTENVRDLVMKFELMGPHLRKLIDKYRDAGAMSKDYVDESAPGSEIKYFMDEMHLMGQYALNIEHMAWVYGGMIERVLMGGISDCSSAVDPDGLEQCIATTKPSDYRPTNDSVSSLLLTDVTASYSRKEKALQLSYSRAVKAAEKVTKAQTKKSRSIWSRR